MPLCAGAASAIAIGHASTTRAYISTHMHSVLHVASGNTLIDKSNGNNSYAAHHVPVPERFALIFALFFAHTRVVTQMYRILFPQAPLVQTKRHSQFQMDNYPQVNTTLIHILYMLTYYLNICIVPLHTYIVCPYAH
jgi:hypothetical protein